MWKNHFGRWENYFGRWGNYFDIWGNYFDRWGNTKKSTRREILFIDSKIQSPKSGNNFIVPLNFDADWSSPDNPARYLSAKGRLKPSVNKYVKCLTYFQNKITIGGVSGCTV